MKAPFIHVWNTNAKPPWAINIHLKTWRQGGEKGPVQGSYQCVWVNGEDEGGQKCQIYFVLVYEYRTMKHVEIVLRKRGRMLENDGEVNVIKTYCMYIYKCNNKSLCTTIIW
jgi:hypothetical protein